MQVKEAKPQTIISKSIKSTLKTINHDIENFPELVYAEVEKSGLKPTGPMVFVYDGVDGNPDREFQLDIALPVESASDYQGELSIKELKPIKYVSHLYKGLIADIGEKGHKPFMSEVASQNIRIREHCREVYLKFEDIKSEDNITEIQLEVE